MCFVTALKARSCRAWSSQRKRQKRVNADCVGGKTIGENGLNGPAEASASTNLTLSEHRKSSDNAVHSCNVLGENEQEKPTQNGALKTNRCLTRGTEEASRHDDNNNASACEPAQSVDGGGEANRMTQRKETVDTQGPTILLHATPPCYRVNKSICIDTGVKKSKKKKKNAQIHDGMEGRTEEEPEDVCRLESVTLDVEPPAPLMSTDETESNGRSLHDDKTDRQGERTSGEHRKWKKRNTKTAVSLWEEHLESDMLITNSTNSPEGGGNGDDFRQSEQSSTTNGASNYVEGMRFKRKKNKKDKKIIAGNERGESVKSCEKGLALETRVELSYPPSIREVTNTLGDGMPTKKGFDDDQSPKPVGKKKQQHEVIMESSEASVPQSEFLAAVQKKKKRGTSSSLCVDAVEKDVQTARKHMIVPAEGLGTQSAKIADTLKQSDFCDKKKKRKRKHDHKDDAETGLERKGDRNENGATEMMQSAAVLSPFLKSDISSPGCDVSKKHQKLRRKLYNPVGDLLE